METVWIGRSPFQDPNINVPLAPIILCLHISAEKGLKSAKIKRVNQSL